nr:hypothetical protein [uncultured Methanobrevibacter sp.]
MKKIDIKKLKIIKANSKILSEIDFDCGDDDLKDNFFVGLDSVIKKQGIRNIPMYRDICEKFN